MAIAESSAYAGLNLDLENDASTDRDALTSFVQTLARQLHARAGTRRAGTESHAAHVVYRLLGQTCPQRIGEGDLAAALLQPVVAQVRAATHIDRDIAGHEGRGLWVTQMTLDQLHLAARSKLQLQARIDRGAGRGGAGQKQHLDGCCAVHVQSCSVAGEHVAQQAQAQLRGPVPIPTIGLRIGLRRAARTGDQYAVEIDQALEAFNWRWQRALALQSTQRRG